jgi:NhaP-type Na+/H+ or K+/H+ antiporter
VLREGSVAGRVEGMFLQLATLGIAAAAFAGATLLDGNGFLAAFTAGLVFGAMAREQCAGVQEFTEDEGELLSLVTFFLFGAVLAGPVLGDVTGTVVLYAALSLTVVRMIPVLLALVGSRMLLETRLFVGWFGPRGLASILFGLLVLEELEPPLADDIFLVVVWTVLLSIYAHGLSAAPWTTRLARRLAGLQPDRPEMGAAVDLPTRRRRWSPTGVGPDSGSGAGPH